MTADVRAVPRNLPALTGIRGVAACWVVLFHVDGLLAPYLPGIGRLAFFRSGFRGVDLFFLLSGFVLMHANGQEFSSIGRADLVRFAILRFTRIYPLNAVVLGMIALLVAFYPGYGGSFADRYTALGFAETLTLSNRWFIKESGAWNGPTWSLSYEVMAYATFPLLARLALRERSAGRSMIAVAGLLGFVAAYQFATGHLTDNPVYRLAVLRAVLTFIAGVFLYVVCRRQVVRRPGALALLCCLAVIALTAWPRAGLLMPFAFAGLILLSTYAEVATTKVLSGRLCMFLGRISFSLYLVHYTMLWWLGWMFETGRASARHAWLDVGCVLAAAVLLATALNRWVERPSQRWGRRWAARWSGVQPVTAEG